jgi:predicted permease
VKLPRWLQWRSRQELDEEIAAHLELATRAGIERGLAPEDAHYAALRQVGNTTRLRERARAADPLFHFENIAKDVRYALRSLLRNPGFTAAAVLSLALGIGVNSTIFSIADGMMFHPLDVPHPEEIVEVSGSAPQYQFDKFTYGEYTTYRDQNRTLVGLMAEAPRSFAVQIHGTDQARIALGDLVTGNYFVMLGIAPAMGRPFLAAEDSPGAQDIVALLSYQNWQTNFHSDSATVGSRITLNGRPVTIIGVLPDGFRGTGDFARPDFYLPLAAMDRLFPSTKPLADPTNVSLAAWGRLKPGVSVQSAQAEFAALAEAARKALPHPGQRTALVLPVVSRRMAENPDDARLLFLLLGIAAIVLLVGCLNVANLLLGRASARVKEITIRQSVGASRGRLIEQLLTESLVLAALGAGAGLLLSEWAIRYFASVRISPDFPSSLPARLDGRVLAYSLIATLAAVVVSGLWPAIRATKVDLISRTKGAAEPAARSFRGRNVLVAMQTALATMLLISASLFVKSFIFASHENPGFRVENVLTMAFDPWLAGFSNARAQAFYQEVEERVSKLPGVRSASLASHMPMGSNSQWNRVAPEHGAGQDSVSVMFNRVGPGYFATMAVPILKGRPIEESDRVGGAGVAVLNQALAQRLWPNGDAVGQSIRFGGWAGAPVLRIVGIAGNGKYQSAVDKFEPYLYLPERQQNLVPMTLLVYTAGDPESMVAAIRAEVKAVAPDMPMYEVHTMKEIFEVHGLLGARLMAQIVGAMGAIGLALGVLGLYAVVAFAVTRRTREIGIRMALGATAASVLRNVLASGVKVTLAGIAIGLAGAFELTRSAAEFLDRVDPHDPAAFLGVSILLLAVAMAACWVPARRASRVDPAVTLRYE